MSGSLRGYPLHGAPANLHEYAPRNAVVQWGTSRLEDEDGAWEGDYSGAYWTRPDVAAVFMVSPEDGVELDPARIRGHTVENEHPMEWSDPRLPSRMLERAIFDERLAVHPQLLR